jgi:hypothetical protein
MSQWIAKIVFTYNDFVGVMSTTYSTQSSDGWRNHNRTNVPAAEHNKINGKKSPSPQDPQLIGGFSSKHRFQTLRSGSSDSVP